MLKNKSTDLVDTKGVQEHTHKEYSHEGHVHKECAQVEWLHKRYVRWIVRAMISNIAYPKITISLNFLAGNGSILAH